MAQVVPTLDALFQMGRRSGLRGRIEERLSRILEAALEIRRFPGGDVDRAAPLVVQVDDFEVSYSLDLDSQTVHVLSVEAFDRARVWQDGPRLRRATHD